MKMDPGVSIFYCPECFPGFSIYTVIAHRCIRVCENGTFLTRAFKHDTFVCCAIEGRGEAVDKRTGLVSGHAYTITDAKKIYHQGKWQPLLRIRNPWGNEVEWTGDWSDKSSSKWNEIDQSEKDRLGYTAADDGEWWMHFDDFINHFDDVTICTVGPDFDSDGAPIGDLWYLSKAKGEWRKDVSAGGCRNYLEKFATNPQYYMELREPDDFDPNADEPDSEGQCSVVIGLMQEYRRVGKAEGLANHFIGFYIYKVEGHPIKRLPIDHFRYNHHHIVSGTFINQREVSLSTTMPPGHYVIVPCTFYGDKVASFLLRLYTEKRISFEELQ